MLPRFTAPLLKVSLQQFLLLITPYLALKKKITRQTKEKTKQQDPTEFKEKERASEPDIAGMRN